MYSVFESEVRIRPDDIDMNNHLHSSKYIDYVLAARFEQMTNNYKMSMAEFIERGMTWMASEINIKFKRELKFEDGYAIVRTQVAEVNGAQAKVNFWVLKKVNLKEAASGYFLYTLVSTSTGRAVRIPEDIIKKYSI